MSRHLLKIKDALFRSSLQRGAPTVYAKPIKHFEIRHGERWVIWGAEKSKFMDVIGNKFISDPPCSLEYCSTKGALPKIESVKFKGAIPTAHLSARYEHFKDEFDQTCGKFIQDNAIGSLAVNYEVSTTNRHIDDQLYDCLLRTLKLKHLENRWAMGLSNGQMRRARLARSLLKDPDFTLIEDPFLGLDPTATGIISEFLGNYTRCSIVIGLRYQDPIPEWCTHVCCVDADGISFQGEKSAVQKLIDQVRNDFNQQIDSMPVSRISVDDLISMHPLSALSVHDIVKMPDVIELRGLSVRYKGEPIFDNLCWSVSPKTTWHIRGDNGTGKSTLFSLITADHPQSWNSRVVENGVPRKPGSTNYFTINERIGMSSPELHAIFVKGCDQLSIKEALSTGFKDNSSNDFLPCLDVLNDSQVKILDIYSDYFGLKPLWNQRFGDVSVSNQKLALFVRS